MPVEVVSTPLLPGLSPVAHKPLEARFDGGQMSSDGGVLLLREVEQRLGVAGRLAGCLIDPRDPTCVTHRLDEIIRFRLLMIAAGYEDGNDATALRSDPMLKLAMDRLPSQHDLCSQSTISRLENLADARSLLRMGRAMVDLYCGAFRQVPGRIVLDIDDTFDAVHGGQQLESIRMSGVFTRRRLERNWQNYRSPGQGTISRRAAGACHRGCAFGSAAAGAHPASSTASAGAWRSAC